MLRLRGVEVGVTRTSRAGLRLRGAKALIKIKCGASADRIRPKAGRPALTLRMCPALCGANSVVFGAGGAGRRRGCGGRRPVGGVGAGGVQGLRRQPPCSAGGPQLLGAFARAGAGCDGENGFGGRGIADEVTGQEDGGRPDLQGREGKYFNAACCQLGEKGGGLGERNKPQRRNGV